MASYQDSVILKFDSPDTGNAAVGRQIAVKQLGLLSNIFSDAELTIPKSNPFLTDQDGFYQFYCADGLYEIEIGNPVERTIQTPIGSISDLVPGVTVLANSLPNDTFLERNNQIVNIADYPELAGTPGYPINSGIQSYVLGTNITRQSASQQHFGFNSKVIYDDNGTIYLTNIGKTGLTGSFLYSDDDGATEKYATTSNTLNLLDLDTNNSIIVAVGRSGRVEVFDYNTKSSIGNTTIGSSDLTYVEHNSGVWTLMDFDGNVFTTTNPLSTWVSDGSLNFGPIIKNGIYAEKTTTGYLIYVNGDDSVFHSTSLLGSPSPSLVYSATSVLDIKISNTHDGNGTIMFNDEEKVLVSTNGGESFYQATASLFFPKNGNLYFSASDTWVLVTDDGEFYYTKDLGESFIKENVTAFFYPWIYFNSNKDAILVPNGSSTRVVFDATLSGGTTFTVSNLDSPNSTDKYYVKAR